MLPSSRRLSVKEFNAVVEKGRTTNSSFFLLKALKLGGPDKSKIATAVPKKVSKTATGRNKIRRRMYEAIRSMYSTILDGYEIIVFAKTTVIDIEFIDLVKEMKNIFVKAGLLK